MKKKDHINLKGKELTLLKATINGERYLTENTALAIANKTIINRWEKNGYLERSRDGLFKVTDALYKEARYQTTPAIKSSGSGSPEHSDALCRVVATLLPTNMPFQDPVTHERTITNSQEARDLLKEFKYTPEYSKIDADIRQQWIDNALKTQLTYNSNPNADNYSKLVETQRLANLARDDKQPIVSSPDLLVNITPTELQDFCQNLREREAEITNWRAKEQYSRAIEQTERLIASATDDSRMQIAIEITTAAYKIDDITTHAAYTSFTSTPVIFLPAQSL